MSDVEKRATMEARLRLTRRVALGYLFIVAGLLFGGWVMQARGWAAGWTPGSESLVRPIYIGAIIIGLLVVVTRRLATSSFVLRAAAGASSGQKAGEGGLRVLMALSLVCGAVAVLVGIGGVYFYKLTGDYQHSLRLGGVSLLLALYSLPRRAEWLKAIA